MPDALPTLDEINRRQLARTLTLSLPGAPRTKKNRGKIWKAGKRTIIMPSEPWMDWRNALSVWATVERIARPHIAAPTNCAAIFYRDRKSGDAVGYYQGLADVLEELGIVADDKYITQWDGSRLEIDRERPRVELTLTPVED